MTFLFKFFIEFFDKKVNLIKDFQIFYMQGRNDLSFRQFYILLAKA